MARKRNAGEGAIFLRGRRSGRGDGRWCAQLTLGWQNGRRVRKNIYGTTAQEVQDKLLKARTDHAAGVPVVVERQSTGEYLARWLETVKPSLGPRTFQHYETVVRLHLAPEIGRLQLNRLTPQHIQALLTRKSKAGLSAQSVRHIRTILRIALNQALKLELIGRNAASLTVAPKLVRKAFRILSPDEARKLLETVRCHRLEAVFTVALSLGLRMGEILGLRWQDVDLDRATLTVNQAIYRIAGKGLVAAEPKTDRSRRALFLPDVVLRGLKTHRKRQLEERLAAGSYWHDRALVFTSSRGTPLEPRNLFRAFKKLLGKAELPDVRFHDLRHSTASLLLAQGVPMRAVMELLGHSSISTTADIYSHVMPTMMRDVAEKMDAILGSR
jgi:integrase